jgi:hypothetical protein
MSVTFVFMAISHRRLKTVKFSMDSSTNILTNNYKYGDYENL